ncbi:unnamed protein product [Didymodactylos carnosus]|uniref:LRRCT domain-containing protein n=1 Tax=Didymodactylos carnosus TaxID=1234261 RepID=A0A814CE13_9BILA|nr:unnamed protein product [Didymodactylos carnosus]CAF3715676.1 unnamed protein product [Didymodactylos carnosus]
MSVAQMSGAQTSVNLLLPRQKGKDDSKEHKKLVYKIPCNNRDNYYVGETDRKRAVRMDELFNDIEKIQNLTSLKHLTLSGNPLNTIPAFNNTNIQTLTMQRAQINSANFPKTYNGSSLQIISLSDNNIRLIGDNDFLSLKNKKLLKLDITHNQLNKISITAFEIFSQSLQSLALSQNSLSSCEFLATLKNLASIKLDQNKFTSLPEQLLIPNNIKNYFFTQNSIKIIDQSSPLSTWIKKNLTGINIYLKDNPLDCCGSLWLIENLKNSNKRYIADANLLTCTTPIQYFGKRLIDLQPTEMNCVIQPQFKLSIADRICFLEATERVPYDLG